MNLQYIAQGIIVLGSLLVIGGTFWNFHLGNAKDKVKEQIINEQNSKILELNYDPIIKTDLIENDKFNFWNFELTNTGTSKLLIKSIYRDYFLNEKLVDGVGDLTINDTLLQGQTYPCSINFSDESYNLFQHIKQYDNVDKKPNIILRHSIKYERIIDKKDFVLNNYYIIARDIGSEIQGKYALIKPERFQDKNIDIHKIIRNIEKQ